MLKIVLISFMLINQLFLVAQEDSLGYYYGELGNLVIIRDSVRLKKHLAELTKYELDLTNQNWEIFNSEELDTAIQEIIKNMEDGIVENDAVGWGGDKPPQFERYEQLKQQCNESDFIKLTRHKTPTIRCYAFWALVQLESKQIEFIINNHKNDEQYLWTLFGCLMDQTSVFDFMCHISNKSFEICQSKE